MYMNKTSTITGNKLK